MVDAKLNAVLVKVGGFTLHISKMYLLRIPLNTKHTYFQGKTFGNT